MMTSVQHRLGLKPLPEAGVDDPHLERYLAALDLLESDRPQGVNAMEEMAHDGSPMAMLFVADALRFGSDYQRDLEKARGWYWHAAQKGSSRALYGLGQIYCSNGEYAQAVENLSAAGDRGCGAALNRLGRMYFDGEGVEANRRRALALWERATKLGYLWAKRNLCRALMAGSLNDKFRGAFLMASAIVDIPLIVFAGRYDRAFI